MKIITCDSSLTCKKWPIWFTKNGHYHLFILSFSRIHFRIFAISVKTSSIFKTFFSRMLLSSSRPSFFFYIFFCFFSLCILKGFPCACILGWIFEEISLKGFETGFLILSSKKKRNEACRKSGQTCSDSLPPNADDQFDLRSVIFYYIFYQNEKTQNVKTKNSNNVFKMIVYHLVQSVQQCLCNDCVSFKAKHMYRVDLENEYEMAFFRNGAKVPILFNISIL